MNTFRTKGGTTIYCKDWGSGRAILFSHGWPLNADAWDPQMLSLGQRGYRVIAHDRRSRGRSEQTWDGNEMDTYADDLAALFETLDLKSVVIVGHSRGGGEVAEDLNKIDIPTLVMHGDDDQIVPIADAGLVDGQVGEGRSIEGLSRPRSRDGDYQC